MVEKNYGKYTCFSPGSEIKIAQSGINKATNSFVDYIHRKFQTISIPDQSGKSKGVSYNFWNIVLDQYNIDPNNAGIQLQPNGDIYIHVRIFVKLITKCLKVI